SIRALPINYGSFDPEFRLRPLTREGRVRPGAPPSLGRGRAGAGSPLAPAWQNIGPTNVAGRVSALAVDPANPAVIYRGTAGRGGLGAEKGGARKGHVTRHPATTCTRGPARRARRRGCTSARAKGRSASTGSTASG